MNASARRACEAITVGLTWRARHSIRGLAGAGTPPPSSARFASVERPRKMIHRGAANGQDFLRLVNRRFAPVAEYRRRWRARHPGHRQNGGRPLRRRAHRRDTPSSATYSPELNPIELCRADMKRRLHRAPADTALAVAASFAGRWAPIRSDPVRILLATPSSQLCFSRRDFTLPAQPSRRPYAVRCRCHGCRVCAENRESAAPVPVHRLHGSRTSTVPPEGELESTATSVERTSVPDKLITLIS